MKNSFLGRSTLINLLVVENASDMYEPTRSRAAVEQSLTIGQPYCLRCETLGDC
jgi:hypothetical protein